MSTNKTLTTSESDFILDLLKNRFQGRIEKFIGINWEIIAFKLQQQPNKLWSLNEMEKTGGEPSLLSYNSDEDTYLFCDFSKESPKNRRSLCYDQKALESRKKHKPVGSAKTMADAMGVSLMTETEYKQLQTFGAFDTKTSSWLETPDTIRALGGAIFGDYRYNQVFIYHNGAESYYAARGFRSTLKI